MTIVRSVIDAVRERRGADPHLPWGDSTPPPPGAASSGVAGVAINESTALSIVAVYACTSILSDACSTLPIVSYTRDGESKKRTKAPTLLDDESPAGGPWAECTTQDWFTQGFVSMALRGNFYGQIAERDRLGIPTQIMPLHPDQVKVRRPYSVSLSPLEYRVNGKIVPTEDMFHVRNIMSPGSVVGLNPIELARSTFALARAAELYGAAFFGNSAQPSGIIEVDHTLDDDETLALAKAWIAAHQGINQAHLPAVLTGGAKWTSIGITPDDAQFLQTRQFSRAEIAMMFRIPPHMIGDVDRTTSWGTGIEQQEIGFVINTLRPYLNRMETALSRLLMPRDFVAFNIAGRLRGDTLQRFQAYTLARNGGWMCVDDIRVREDMDPLPNGLGTDYLQPLNFVPIGNAPAQMPPTGSDAP